MPLRRPITAAFLLACLVPAAFAEDYVWWEGEAAAAKSDGLRDAHVFNSPNPKLSGGKSLGGDVGPGTFAEYAIEVPRDGAWRLYVRKFWHHGPFRWRFDGQGDWRTVDHFPLLDSVDLAPHCINWVQCGTTTLAKGRHTLRVEAIKKAPFVLDCFVLTLKPFVPSGLRKPGEKLGLADPGCWAFEPDFDGFDRPALLDLRPLNEKIAGESGAVRATKDGDFALGNGKPVRFWCANTEVQRDPGTEDLALHARHLAKRGVNMVRHHGHLNPGEGQRIDEPDAKDIEAARKLVAVMKREGIYTTISPYWATSKGGAGWGIPGHAGGELFTLLFWDETLQKAYKGWVRALLSPPNPHDANKTPLAKDPALAIFQIQNEDSFLFWTTSGFIKGEKLARLQAVYDRWRQGKGLGPGALNFKFWELKNPTRAHRETMRFFTESMHAWHREVARWLREEIGYRGLINAGNWRTADQVRLLDLERWSYAANEVIGVNRYVTGGAHVNPGPQPWRNGYAIDRGDYFQDVSCLLEPRKLATNAKQVAGLPYIISESCWVPPMSHQSEGPFLVAATSALNGVDGFYWFSTGHVGWSQNLGKWAMADPVQMGGWPAAALMFRLGCVKRGAPAVHEERAIEDLWELKTPVIAEDEGFDPNRDAGDVAKASAIRGGVHPLAYLVGPVEVTYGGDPARSRTADLAKYIDESKKTARSITGEIAWDYGLGVCRVDAPAAQGATGFLAKAGPIRLSTVTIESKDEYATILAVSMDGSPLAASRKILLQATTRARPYGWRQSPATFQDKDRKHTYEGFRVDATGDAPWNVAKTDATITVRNASLRKATRLDPNGYAAGELKGKMVSGAFELALPPDALYVILE